ncbi:MAG TPA: hypothetical protein PK129_02300, partial [Cellvibrionaceae bacterium]|nr:hypothetical protein [Cellvibrionaceae bacterium]
GFITQPVYGGELLRNQSANIFFGRNDYLPFAKIEVGGLGFERSWSKFDFYSSFQRSDVSSPSYSYEAPASPDIEEKEYLIGVNTTLALFDSFSVEYFFNKSAALYDVGVLPRPEIPNLFETDVFRLSVDKLVWRGVIGRLALSSVQQDYAIPKFGSVDDSNSRVSFVNVNLSVSARPCNGCTINFVVHNVLDNNKNYIEGYLADFVGAEQAATLDQYFTERVTSLSVNVRF